MDKRAASLLSEECICIIVIQILFHVGLIKSAAFDD